MQLILGSASKWRRKILQDAGYSFKILSPNIDEKSIRDSDPETLVLKIARAKAAALLPQITEPSLLITTDQVVYCHDEIFEKPASAEEVKKFITAYHYHSAQTVTAVIVTNTATGKSIEGVDVVNIHFNHIPDSLIDHLIEEGEIFQCAGGFQIEDEKGELNPYIKSIDGEIDSVKGLPMKLLNHLIAQIKYSS